MGALIINHNEVQESTLRAVLAGGAAAVVAGFLPAPFAAPLSALAVGCALIPPRTIAAAAVVLVWSLVAGAGARIGGGLGEAIEALAIGGLLARGTTGVTRPLSAALGAVGALTATLVGRAFFVTGALESLPSGIEALLSGATSGFILGVASIGRHISWSGRRVDDELASLADESELGRLLGRAATAYRDAVSAIGDDAKEARAAADELVGKMTRFGRRWRELEAEAARSSPAEVGERLALVGRRLESTSDPLARVELARAREALTAQLAYLDEIRCGRERAVARFEHQVATLERLRLAALRHRSADAGRIGSELAPIVEELTQVGGDFDIAAAALDEAGSLRLSPRGVS
jgi:hypothetical protein